MYAQRWKSRLRGSSSAPVSEAHLRPTSDDPPDVIRPRFVFVLREHEPRDEIIGKYKSISIQLPAI